MFKVLCEDLMLHLKMSSNKVKQLKREQLFNLSMPLWEAERNYSQDG